VRQNRRGKSSNGKYGWAGATGGGPLDRGATARVWAADMIAVKSAPTVVSDLKRTFHPLHRAPHPRRPAAPLVA